MLNRMLPLVTVLAFAAPAHAQDSADRYLAFVLGSTHFGADLNGVNPGLLLGHRWPTDRDGLEFHVEGGVFYNSYDEVSPIFLAGASHRLARFGSFDLRAGLSFGTAYYATLAPTLERDYNIPNLDGFIPLVVASLSLRPTRNPGMEYRLTALPGDAGIGALNLSIAVDF